MLQLGLWRRRHSTDGENRSAPNDSSREKERGKERIAVRGVASVRGECTLYAIKIVASDFFAVAAAKRHLSVSVTAFSCLG